MIKCFLAQLLILQKELFLRETGFIPLKNYTFTLYK